MQFSIKNHNKIIENQLNPQFIVNTSKKKQPVFDFVVNK